MHSLSSKTKIKTKSRVNKSQQLGSQDSTSSQTLRSLRNERYQAKLHNLSKQFDEPVHLSSSIESLDARHLQISSRDPPLASIVERKGTISVRKNYRRDLSSRENVMEKELEEKIMSVESQWE